MNEIYQKALIGELASPAHGTKVPLITIENFLPVPIKTYWIDTEGHFDDDGGLYAAPFANRKPGAVQWQDLCEGDYILITFPYTGGFIGIVQVQSGTTQYAIGYHRDSSKKSIDLVSPNDAGPIPEPRGTVIIPADSPRVVVGTGAIRFVTLNNFLVREQFWHRTAECYSLAAKEKREISTTKTSGRQSTSSSEQTLASSVAASASAGWGPISASISSSLSSTSTTFQQVTITEETTSYVSDTVFNDTDKPVTVLKWQLMEIVTIFQGPFDPSNQGGCCPLASLINKLDPVIIKAFPMLEPSVQTSKASAERKSRPTLVRHEEGRN